MSEQRKQEHNAVSVEDVGGRVRINFTDVELRYVASVDVTAITLNTLESAEALRDALSAFITFHRRVDAKTGT